jgi:excisionase family DNA binding protein
LKKVLNTNTALPKLLFTIAEAAEILGTSRWTLIAHQRRGDLKTVSIGRAVRIHASEITRIANEGLSSLAPPSAIAA